MRSQNKIYFNIWDDYYDDGHVPPDQAQETYGYTESHELSEKEQEALAEVVYNFVKTIDLPGVEVKLSGVHVDFNHLTHRLRETALLPALESSGLQFNGKPIRFYSES